MGASSYHAIQQELEKIKKIAQQDSGQQTTTIKLKHLKFILYGFIMGVLITLSTVLVSTLNTETLNRRIDNIETISRDWLMKKSELHRSMPLLILPKACTGFKWQPI